MNTLIDSHVHFWDRERFSYAWLDDVPDPLSRSAFLPADTDPAAQMVFVQADCREDQGVAEAAWVQEVVDTYIDASSVMALCTPSRINNEGDPAGIEPRRTNWGRGFGDYFAYRELLQAWLAAGDLEGLELR